MSKYKEIMDNIELTDEMRERVLKNVKAASASSSEARTEERTSKSSGKTPASPAPVRKANRTMILSIIGYAAACLLISVGVFFSWKGSQRGNQDPSASETPLTEVTVTTSSGISAGGPDSSYPSTTDVPGYPIYCEDISGINKEFSFALLDLTTLPFTPVQKTYVAYSNVAEIVYTGTESDECVWRISPDAFQITAIAENFSSSKEIKLDDGSTFNLYGDDGAFSLATWFDGTNYQSIQFLKNEEEATFKAIVSEILSMA